MPRSVESHRLEILIQALNERYSAMHKIRERVQNVGVWAIGLSVAASTWLLQSKAALNHFEKGLIVFGIAVAYWAVRTKYLGDLERGFRGQQLVASRIEGVLGLYDPGALADLPEPIYPLAWKDAGTEKGKGKYFSTTNTMLDVGSGFLIVTVIFSGIFSS